MSEGRETFSIDTFLARLDDRFALDFDGRDRFDLQLVEVTKLGSATRGRRAPFSLVFQGPAKPLLRQRIYSLEHAELGAFDLFLVPIGPGSYEAVFT